MAGHDDHEGVAGNRLRDRVRGAGSPELARDFAIGAGFAARNRARELVNPLIEGVNAAHVERDVGEIGRLAAQQRDNALDRDFDIQRRAQFAGVGILAQQPPAGFDLARFGQLHADNAEMAPCDAASADPRVEYGVPTPRHYATLPQRHHSTAQKRAPGKYGQVKAAEGGEYAQPALGGSGGLG